MRSNPDHPPRALLERPRRERGRPARSALIPRAVVVALGLAGCATSARLADDPQASEADREPAAETILVVESRFPGPVIVWIVSGSRRLRLGTVSIGQDLRLVMPSDYVGRGADVRLVARPVGSSDEVWTERFGAEPGDLVSWTIIRPLANSSATLRLGLGGLDEAGTGLALPSASD